MEAKRYRIENKARDSSLVSSVSVIDATLEPLRILKVLVEGLAANAEAGVWLKNMNGIPMVPRISPFDLVYLDKNLRVVKGVELLPVGDFPPFKNPAASALVLPFQSVKRSKTRQGDRLIFTEIEEASSEIEEATTAIEEPSNGIVDPSPIHHSVAQPEELPHQPKSASVETEEQTEEKAEPVPVDEEFASFELDGSALEDGTETPALDEEVVSGVSATNPRNAEAATDLQEPEDEPVVMSVSISPALEERGAEARIEVVSETDDSASHLSHGYSVTPRFAMQNPQVNDHDDSAAKEKEWMVSRFLRWLYPGAYETDRRKGRRIPIPDLVAYNLSGSTSRALEVADISSTGVFLVTEERWTPGTLLCLSLQREGPREDGNERRIQVQADPVRWERNGVGLSFVLPTGMDLRLWEQPSKDHVRQSAPEYVVREFRLARAVAFLGRISPPALEEARRLLHNELSNVRVECAVNVFLKAEERLMREFEGADSLFAHPDLIVRIIHGASWADTEMMQDVWGGLLITSCTHDGCDDSNLPFIKLLSQFAAMQMRLLMAICSKAGTAVSNNQIVAVEKMFCSSEELTRMTGTHDLLKIHRSLAQLAEFGVLEKSMRASFVSEKEGATTTPTNLGLQMYARCLGHRENA